MKKLSKARFVAVPVVVALVLAVVASFPAHATGLTSADGLPARAEAGFTMSPIVGIRTTGPDNCSIGPISGTNCPVTVVLRGEGLPTAEPSSIGVAVSGNDSIVTVEDNDDGSNGWLAGHDTNFFTTCKVIIGASTSTELIFQVGNIGPTCPNHSILPGDKVEVTLFNPNFSVFGTQTATAGAPAADPDVPVVSEVVPPYGPVTGGTNSEPGTGRVTVAASNAASPVAAWFGDVATSDITRVDDTHVSIVPPPSPPDQDNEGIALQLADSVTGTTPQHCAILLPTGCANQFFYLSENSATFTSPPLNLDLSLGLGGTQSAASKACGINGSTGTSSGLSINAGLHGGPVSVTAGYGVSNSSAGVPEAFVGSGTLTVENAIEISVSLSGTVSACEQIAIPNLGIPGIAGFYFVVGGSITADVTLTITIHKGTYSLTGGFMPGSNPGDLRDVTMDAQCVDEDGNPLDECVTTEFSAALTGILSISPLWLQIGPDFANVGAGLSAAAIGTISYPPLAVDGDICVAGNWVAQANFGPLSASTGGSWLGPFNVVGNGAMCPFGDAGGDPPTTPTSTGLASSANPSAPGDEVAFTASVTPTPDGGTVSFTDNGEDVADCQDVVVDESGNAPCAVSFDDPGSHAIVATYSGNDGFAGSASSTVDQVVSDAPPVTPTSTGVVPSLNPSSPGDEVTFTATVSPAPDGGTVSFTDDGRAHRRLSGPRGRRGGRRHLCGDLRGAGVARDRGDFQRRRDVRGFGVVDPGPGRDRRTAARADRHGARGVVQPVGSRASGGVHGVGEPDPRRRAGVVHRQRGGRRGLPGRCPRPVWGSDLHRDVRNRGDARDRGDLQRPRCVRGFDVLDARAGGERRHAADARRPSASRRRPTRRSPASC